MQTMLLYPLLFYAMTHKVKTVCALTNQPCRNEASGKSSHCCYTFHVDLNPSPLPWPKLQKYMQGRVCEHVFPCPPLKTSCVTEKIIDTGLKL